jgi:hypothetical protein
MRLCLMSAWFVRQCCSAMRAKSSVLLVFCVEQFGVFFEAELWFPGGRQLRYLQQVALKTRGLCHA